MDLFGAHKALELFRGIDACGEDHRPCFLQHQVDWITGCIAHLRARGLTEIEPTRQTQDEWVKYHDDIANATLISKTNSWYMGSNVDGKPRRLLAYIGGVGNYNRQCDELAANGYQGFAMT